MYCGGGDPTEWPEKLDHYFPLFATLKDQYKVRAKKMKIKLKLSVCDAPTHPREDRCNVMCFGASRKPGGLNWMSKVVGLTVADIDDFFAYLDDGFERNLTIHKLSVPHLFVCCHTTKDERCGYCGPRIADAFKGAGIGNALVYKTSHIGGHKYAANVVIYPSGHWWGYVRPKDISRLLPLVPLGLENEIFTPESLLPGPPPGLVDLWRGRMGLTKDEQKKLTPNAKGKSKGNPVETPVVSPSPPTRTKSVDLRSSPSSSSASSSSASVALNATSSVDLRHSGKLKPLEVPLTVNVTTRTKINALPPQEGWTNPMNRNLFKLLVLLFAMLVWASWRHAAEEPSNV
jgi:hypothetical protein